MKKRLVLCGLALFACATLLAQGDIAKGKAKYNAICVTCHGAEGEGNKALNSPAVAGQEQWYLARQLKYFKEGIRGGDAKDLYGMQMRPMSMVLVNDAEIDNVAAYVSSLPAKKFPHELGGDPNRGKALYTTCIACHGPDALGMKTMNSPKLTIQQDWYILRQLKNFKEGIRGANPKDIYGMQMRPMAMVLADEKAMKDVIAYIQMNLAK